MPRGSNPNSRKNLKSYKSGDPAAKAAQSKGGKRAAANKAAYKSLREHFKERLTDEDANQIYDILYALITKNKNLKALDRFTAILGDSSSAQVSVDATIGGGVIMMESQADGEK